MAQLPILVSAEGSRQMKDLSKRMKEAGRGDLRRQLRAEIKEAGKPVVADLKRAVTQVDVTSSRGGSARPNRSTGLRRRVARATTLSVTQNGIRIVVRSRRQPFPTAAKYLDASVGRFGRWRHPVFGNMDVWAQQQGESWFFVTITKHRRQFRRAAFEAMERISNEITD